MSKKRNRQPDANGDTSEGSVESCEEAGTAETCAHTAKAVNLSKLKKGLKKSGIGKECAACKKNEASNEKNDEDGAEVLDCPLWICLRCGHQGCGRSVKKHAIEHYQRPQSDCHCMVVDTHRWSVWCYQCEKEVSADSRKRLLETVEFVKRSASSGRPPLQNKMPIIPCQKEISDIDKDKQKILNNLPKVGGLVNLGNTCFFNAVLQCLAQTPFLIKVLDDSRAPGQQFVLPGGKRKSNENDEAIELPPIKGTLEGWGTFTAILWKTLTEMQSTTGQTYKPTELLSAFKKKTMQCMDGGQHDSHELLRHLLDIVRNEDLRRYQTIILKEVGLSEKTKPDCVEDGLKSRVKFYGNQASARVLGAEFVFRGVLVSTIECLDCHHSSQRTEPFLDLSLPMMPDKPQPPILKRKDNDIDDKMGSLADEFLAVLSKYPVKKEKIPARKIRRRREVNATHVPLSSNDDNNQWEVTSDVAECSFTFEEKNDADVEDNIEAEEPTPEIGESGYGSEKASAVASPVSPAPHNIHHHASNQSLDLPSKNGLPITSNLLLSPIDSLDAARIKEITPNDALSPSPTDVSMTDLSQPRLLSEGDRLESSGSPENENGGQGLSLSGSLAINSDLTSPEAPTVSPLSSSASSKDSPTSPLSSTMNGEDHLAEDAAGKEKEDKEKEDSGTLTLDERWAKALKLSIRFKRDQQRRPDPEHEQEASNWMNDITSDMSRLGISNNDHQSPTRYATKEGEYSIQSCLNQFAALELMSGSNKVGCKACTAREKNKKEGSTQMVCTPSTKQYLVSEVPAVLILHLKRFQTQRVGVRKVTKHVSFPPLLDLAPVCKGHRKQRLYALYGVVEHSGTLHGGHYVAYVKSRQPLTPDDPRWSFLLPKYAKDDEEESSSQRSDSDVVEVAVKASDVEPPPGRWYFVSDSHVTEVDESTVLQSQAYLLFYERIL